jgi:hypothetical protein
VKSEDHNLRSEVGRDSVFVIPVGPTCQIEFVADTIDSIQYYAPLSRIILVDDSLSGIGIELADRYELTCVKTKVHGLFGNLYLNLSVGFREALAQPFRILVRLDTDALITGSDFEAKAIQCFEDGDHVGSLGSFRIGYDQVGIRNRNWAKHRIIEYLLLRAWKRPRNGLTVVRLLLRARANGYRLGESIMGGAVVYSHEALVALDAADLLGRSELAGIGVHEDHVFGLCLCSIGFHLSEFGNKFDDLPMGVDWRTLPATPEELMKLGKSIVHSTKSYGSLDERAIRSEFRAARRTD